VNRGRLVRLVFCLMRALAIRRSAQPEANGSRSLFSRCVDAKCVPARLNASRGFDDTIVSDTAQLATIDHNHRRGHCPTEKLLD
jgi:hypothetical protein